MAKQGQLSNLKWKCPDAALKKGGVFLHMIAITVQKAQAKAYVWTLEKKKKDFKKVQLHSLLL